MPELTAADVNLVRDDLWFCADKTPHEWLYRGKNKGYRCHHCGVETSKEQLKAATDA